MITNLWGSWSRYFIFFFGKVDILNFILQVRKLKIERLHGFGERYYKPCPLALFIHSTNTHYASAVFLLTLPLNGDKTMKKIENVSKPMSLNSLQ